jgi:hypothetical protein
MSFINDLSKEDLISIIANMHDTILDWNGRGLPDHEIDFLTKIGSDASSVTAKSNNWDLNPIIDKSKVFELKK